jgi:hypothetical protein
LPKPLRFNLYSLQFFPNYPLTQKAIEDGHITRQEASLDHLNKKMARNWAFVPRLFPLKKKQIMHNIIWLIVYGRVEDRAVKQAIFNEAPSTRLKLTYLNLKAIFLGKIYTAKRRMQKRS